MADLALESSKDPIDAFPYRDYIANPKPLTTHPSDTIRRCQEEVCELPEGRTVVSTIGVASIGGNSVRFYMTYIV